MLIAYSPWGNGHSIFPFGQIFKRSVSLDKMSKDDKPDAILLWGGTDIHPSYYNQKHHPHSQAPNQPSDRDVFEWRAMKWAKANGIPIIGVCRGAQFLCAFAGGSLIQHTTGHGKDHLVVCSDGELFNVTSSHHQMLYLPGSDGQLLAWSRARLSNIYEIEQRLSVDVKVEPEIVYFPSCKGLAIQGHPEWADLKDRFVQKTMEYIREYLLTAKETVEV